MKKKDKDENKEDSKYMNNEIKKLMIEIDTEVKRLIDIFRFVLKYRIVFRGRGVEFAGIRKYLPTDDASLIDWKVSARMSTSGKLDKLYVKIYEEERDLNVIVMFDVSESMIFGTQNRLKIEYGAVLAGTIAHAALEVGDNLGLVLYNEKARKVIPPMKGDLQYFKVLKEIVDKRNWGGLKNTGDVLSEVVKTAKGRTFLFIISDFIGETNKWEETLRSAVSRFDGVLALMIRDVRDEELPKNVGDFRFSDPFYGEVTDVNIDKIREKYERLAKEQEDMIINMFEKAGAGIIKYRTDESFITPMMKWFSLWGAGRG